MRISRSHKTMKTVRAALTAACLLACTGCALPGYESPGFRGQILDRTTNMPIANARVSATPFWGRRPISVTLSDTAGRFAIAPDGALRGELIALHPISMAEAWTDARIEVSADGYAPQQQAALDLTKRETPALVIYLDRN
jgi:hypothetical protein